MLIVALVVIIILLVVIFTGTFLFMGWKMYQLYEENDRAAVMLGAYKDALQRPSYATLTEEQVHRLAELLNEHKKELIN